MVKGRSEKSALSGERLSIDGFNKRQNSHRSLLTSGRASDAIDPADLDGGQSSYRNRDGVFDTQRSGTSGNEQLSEPQRSARSAGATTNQGPMETDAVSVRRIRKKERRLSRITLNRNLTLN